MEQHSRREEVVEYQVPNAGGSRWLLASLALACTVAVFALLPFSEMFTASPEKQLEVRQVDTAEAAIKPPELKEASATEPQLQSSQGQTSAPDEAPRLESPEMKEKKEEPLKPNLDVSYDMPRQSLDRDVSLDFEVTEPTGTRAPRTDEMRGEPAQAGKAGAKLEGHQGPYRPGDVDRQPSAVARRRPNYPYRARRQGKEAEVRVRFIVTENGKTRDVEILDSDAEDMFRNAVKSAVSGWKFKPATRDGEPVPVVVTTTVRFELK